MKNRLPIFLFTLLLAACTENGAGPAAASPLPVTDAQLYALIRSTPRSIFYKHSPDTIPGNSGAAHAGMIVVRYDHHASTRLDAQGKVQSGALFPDSSLIIKEIFGVPADTLLLYAVMFKLPAAANAGPGGWVWAELKPDGAPFISADKKGAACGFCHSAGTDFTRMNDTHP